MSTIHRYCVVCLTTEIQESMGFTLARDFLAGVHQPREICARCAVGLLDNETYLEAVRSL